MCCGRGLKASLGPLPCQLHPSSRGCEQHVGHPGLYSHVLRGRMVDCQREQLWSQPILILEMIPAKHDHTGFPCRHCHRTHSLSARPGKWVFPTHEDAIKGWESLCLSLGAYSWFGERRRFCVQIWTAIHAAHAECRARQDIHKCQRGSEGRKGSRKRQDLRAAWLGHPRQREQAGIHVPAFPESGQWDWRRQGEIQTNEERLTFYFIGHEWCPKSQHRMASVSKLIGSICKTPFHEWFVSNKNQHGYPTLICCSSYYPD